MPQSWSVEFINDNAEGEFRELPADVRAKFIHIVEMIEEIGLPHIGKPHVKQVEGKVWEMRATGGSGHARGLYATAPGQRVVMLNFFQKKSNKVPKKQIRLAEDRMEEIADA
jgi:phage-related protein